MKTVIHVNRQMIAKNAKLEEPKYPTYIVRRGNKSIYGYAVKIDGPSVLVDPRKHKPLKCGARAWIETDSKVTVIGSMPYSEVKKMVSS